LAPGGGVHLAVRRWPDRPKPAGCRLTTPSLASPTTRLLHCRIRFGVLTPRVILPPGRFNAWAADVRAHDLPTLARAADRLGYHHLTCSEHVAVPTSAAAVRGGTYWDPLATLSYLAAHTAHIGLATHVLVLGYHHPLAVAKRYGTLDRLSGGR